MIDIECPSAFYSYPASLRGVFMQKVGGEVMTDVEQIELIQKCAASIWENSDGAGYKHPNQVWGCA